MRNRIVRDIVINLIAASICTIVLNFIVYPFYARRFSDVDYGIILTLVGIVNLLWSVLGNCLNNTRLVLNKRNDIENENGNYNPLAFFSGCIGGLVILLFYSFFPISSMLSMTILVPTVVVGIIRAYYVVSFRLELNYIAQLKTNIIVASGYFVGVLIANKIELWPLPFFLGELTALVYVLFKGVLIKEPFRFTIERKIVIFTYFDLIVTSIVGNLIAYFDRFLVYPLLGPASVSIYSVASFWGKAVTPLIAPISSVMLSYLSQKESKISIKKFFLIFVLGVIPLLSFGIIGKWIAPMIIGLLYPTLVVQANPYIFTASMGSLIQSSTNLLMPLLLSVCSSRSISVMQMVYFAVYVFVSCIGVKISGLKGFCISMCIVGVFKVIIILVFGYKSICAQKVNAD